MIEKSTQSSKYRLKLSQLLESLKESILTNEVCGVRSLSVYLMGQEQEEK